MPNVKNQNERPSGVPELERTTLTPEEERAFLEAMEQILPESAAKTREYLDGHRYEAQGQ